VQPFRTARAATRIDVGGELKIPSVQRTTLLFLVLAATWFLPGAAQAQSAAAADAPSPTPGAPAPAHPVQGPSPVPVATDAAGAASPLPAEPLTPASAVSGPAAAAPAGASTAPSHTTGMVVEGAFGKGATIRTSDEKFSLNIRGRIQARATMTEHNDGKNPVTGMQIRRMRIVFQGNALGPALTYYIQLAFSNLDMEPDLRSPLRDAYFTWAVARDANLRVGQMKVPYGRQRVVSSSALQLPDRSIVIGELNLDRDVGLHLFSKDLFGLGGKLGYSLAVFGGDGRNRIADKFGLLYAARVQLTPLGSFDDFSEGDIKREPSPKLAIGFGGAYNQNTNRPRSTIDTPYQDAHFDYAHAGADLLFKWQGLSVQAEWMWRKADQNSRSGEVAGSPEVFYSRSGWGAFGQVGQMVVAGLEVVGRYGYLAPLAGADQGIRKRQELGGGLSYYFREHNLKLQGDYFYLPTGSFEAGTHEVRVQSQLYF
jgi:phosphate-selective porin OprO/OprP